MRYEFVLGRRLLAVDKDGNRLIEVMYRFDESTVRQEFADCENLRQHYGIFLETQEDTLLEVVHVGARDFQLENAMQLPINAQQPQFSDELLVAYMQADISANYSFRLLGA